MYKTGEKGQTKVTHQFKTNSKLIFFFQQCTNVFINNKVNTVQVSIIWAFDCCLDLIQHFFLIVFKEGLSNRLIFCYMYLCSISCFMSMPCFSSSSL